MKEWKAEFEGGQVEGWL
ncbi:hypothetical protein ABVN23_20055 [Pseudomonas fluorescens]